MLGKFSGLDEHLYIRDVAVLPNGKYFAVGKATVEGDGVLARFEPTDKMILFETIGWTGSADLLNAVTNTSDGNLIAVGELGSQTSWIKLTSEGVPIWKRDLMGSGSNDHLEAVAVKSDGSFYFAGNTNDQTPKPNDALVMKLTSTGSIEWAKSFNSGGYGNAFGVHEASDGSAIACGYTKEPAYNQAFLWKLASSDGSTTWLKKWGAADKHSTAKSCVATSDGGIFVTGHTEAFSAQTQDIFAAKFDSNGAVEWFRMIGSTENGEASGGIQTTDGKYVMTGSIETYYGSGRHWLAVKLDSDGSVIWIKTLGLDDFGWAYGPVEHPDGDFLSTGYIIPFGKNPVSFISRIAADGESCDFEDWPLHNTSTPIVASETLTPAFTYTQSGWSASDPVGYEHEANVQNVTIDFVCRKCPDKYIGDYCDVFKCGNGFSNETLCNGNGTCDVPGGSCVCKDDFYGSNCEVFQCGNGFSNETLCNGRGSCGVPGGSCACFQYCYGKYCDVFECDGFLSNGTVCNGQGTCTEANGKCICNPEYNTPKCKDKSTGGSGDVDGDSGGVIFVSALVLVLLVFFSL